MIENKQIEYENTVIVGVVNREQGESVVKDYLDELSFLSETAGGVVKKRFIQKLDSPNPKTFIGTGKISEIQLYNKKNDISSVIFDDELSPTQQGNLERILKCKIIDRTGLILFSWEFETAEKSKFFNKSGSLFFPNVLAIEIELSK